MFEAIQTITTPPASPVANHQPEGVTARITPSRRAILAGAAAMVAPVCGSAPVSAAPAVAAAVPAQPTAKHPDVELLQLGEQLAAAWTAEETAVAACQGENDDNGPLTTRAFHLAAVASSMVDQIEQASATTLDGLRVKMQAIAWCRDGDPMTIEDLAGTGEPTTDALLVASILRDLDAMGGQA